jgi:CrcB protein
MPQNLRMLLAVGVGGALGTVARYELGLRYPVATGAFPWTTFGINIAGSFLLGVVLAIVVDERPRSHVTRALLAVGVCGGFTTFSTWMVETVLLARGGDAARGAAYVLASLVAGLISVTAGVIATRALLRRPVELVFDPHEED